MGRMTASEAKRAIALGLGLSESDVEIHAKSGLVRVKGKPWGSYDPQPDGECIYRHGGPWRPLTEYGGEK